MPDLPIENTAADLPVTDLAPAVSVQSPKARNVDTAQSAAIETSLNPDKSFFTEFRQLANSQPDMRSTLKRTGAKQAARDQQEFMDVFKQQPGGSPEEIQTNYEATQSIVGDIQKEATDENLQYVRAASQGQLSPEEEKQVAVRLSVTKMIKDISDSMGITDHIFDIGGMLIPGNVAKDNYDMTGSVLDAKEWMQRFITNFKSLPADRQLELLPTVKDVLYDKLDNDYKVIGVLNQLLSPSGTEDLSDFNAIWAGLDAGSVLLLGSNLAFKVGNVVSKLNAPKILGGASDVRNAADVAAGAVLDDAIAQGANLDRSTTAVNDVTGIKFGDQIDPAFQGNLSGAAVQRINQFTQQAQNTTNEIAGSDMFLRESLLQSAERQSVEAAKIEEFNQLGFENVAVDERHPNMTVIGFDRTEMPDVVLGEHGTAQPIKSRVRYKMQLTLNDVGKYEQDNVGLVSQFLGSNTVWAKKNLKESVQTAIRLDSAQGRVYKQLSDLHREAVKGILGPLGLKGLTPSGRTRLAQLDHVLQAGDKEQRVYSPLELQAGVDGVKLDEAQQEAYYKVRSVVNSLFELRNSAKREELQIKGMRHVIYNAEGEAQIGRPFLDENGARASLAQSRPKILLDTRSGRIIATEDLDLQAEYAHNLKLVKFAEPIKAEGGEQVTYGLVRTSDIKELPHRVLHYRAGYVPKINLNTNWFVKEFSPTRIDGKDISAAEQDPATATTIRYFDNQKDANAWAAEFQRANPKRTIRVLDDRQLEQERRGGAGGPGVGGFGLYTGPRSVEEIPFGFEGTTAERLNSFESISRNLSSIARFVPRNAWRLGMEQRALNTANALLPGAHYTSFSELSQASEGLAAGRFIRKLHKQIEEWMGFPTKEEQLFEALVQDLYEKAAGTKMPGIGKKSLLYLKHKDPVAAARAAAFHSLLGWFNPIQLWVQAQGATVALGTNLFRPGELTKSIRIATALAAVDHLEDAKAIAWTEKAFGFKAGELATIKKLWEKTGLRDSILQTADHAAAARGHGIAMDALSRTADKGLVFYRAGELFNRRISFATALARFQAENKGVAVTDEALKGILTRANNMMLNLTRSNRAQWQKGVLSLPTQFLQISTKTIETLLGMNGDFTLAERGQILTSQILLYGAAGIPLGSMGALWLAQAMGYRSQSDIEKNMTPEMRKLVNEGFEGWATMAMFGVDVDVGQRASLANGVNQFVDKLVFQDTNAAEMFLGAFGTTNSRFWSGFSDVWEPVSMGMAGVRTFDPLIALSDMGKSIATWNNVSKALFMHRFDRILDRHGNTVYHKDFTPAEEIFQAIGFRPSPEVQTWELKDVIKANKQLRADVTDEVVKTIWDYTIKAQKGDATPEYKDAVRRKMDLLMQSLDTAWEQDQVRNAVRDRLTNGTDEYSRQWQKFRQEFNNGQVNALEAWRLNLTSRGILQEKTVDEETK